MSNNIGLRNLKSQSHEVLELDVEDEEVEEMEVEDSDRIVTLKERLQGIFGRRRLEILTMVLFSVLLPLADEGSDLFSALRYF